MKAIVYGTVSLLALTAIETRADQVYVSSRCAHFVGGDAKCIATAIFREPAECRRYSSTRQREMKPSGDVIRYTRECSPFAADWPAASAIPYSEPRR